MTSTPRSRRRWRASVAAVAGVGLLTAGTAVANAAAPAVPPLGLVTTAGTVDLTNYPGADGEPGYTSGDLGTHIIAGADPFEIKVTRKSYADPIVAEQVIVKKGKKTTTKLPAGMVTDFSGLKDFATVTLKDATGQTVLSKSQNWCPNSYDSTRSRPEAPDTTPYPQGCSYGNPFLFGNIWGVQAGWNSSAVDYLDAAGVPDGTYQATVEITQKYRDHFKIPADRATGTLTVNVRTDTDTGGGKGRGEAALTARAEARKAAGIETAGDHQHLTEGDSTRQGAPYHPDLRPPASRPTTLSSRAAAPKGPRPDLRSLPAWDVALAAGRDEEGNPGDRTYLEFAATVWNAGTSRLVVDGFRRTGTDLMDAYQYFYDAKDKQVGSVGAGTMEWDPREGHFHWHFTDFAQYRLLGADQKTVVVNSGKEAFCLVNTDAVDYTLPNAKWRPSNTDLSSSCGQNTAVAVRQVLDIGSGDTYGRGTPGQAIDVTDVPNGTYYLEVLANPSNKLAELDTTNNQSLRKVILSGSGADRKVEVPAVHGIDGPAAG